MITPKNSHEYVLVASQIEQLLSFANAKVFCAKKVRFVQTKTVHNHIKSNHNFLQTSIVTIMNFLTTWLCLHDKATT
jgi:hypothetical protein